MCRYITDDLHDDEIDRRGFLERFLAARRALTRRALAAHVVVRPVRARG